MEVDMGSRLLLVLVLAAALAACSQVPAEPPSVDSMATVVAATLSALAPASVSSTEVPSVATPPEPSPAAPASPPIVRVAYTNAGNIWLAEGDAPPVQLTSSGAAENVWISDDGQKVVFTRRPAVDGPVEIRAVNRDGSGEALLAASDAWNGLYDHASFVFNDLQNMGFVPGTHRLLLNTRGVPEGPGLARFNDLLQLDADSGALTSLRAPEAGGDFLVSPDGQKLALIQHDHISLLTISGSDLRPSAITFAPVITYSEYLYHPAGQWTPDSSAVGFAIPSSDPLAPDPSGTIWRLPADGGPAISLATIPGGFFFTQSNTTALSPDLAWVAFQRDTTTTNVRNLILAHADGTGEAIVATGQLFWGGWSPDSTHYAYGQDAPMNLQLGALGAPATALGSGTQFRWVNESMYVYLSGTAGAWTLMRGSIGSPAVALASPSGDFVSYDLTYR
jgi:hypothetical protein